MHHLARRRRPRGDASRRRTARAAGRSWRAGRRRSRGGPRAGCRAAQLGEDDRDACSPIQGRPERQRLHGGRAERRRGRPRRTPGAAVRRARPRQIQREGAGDRRDVVEHALADLVEALQSRQRQRHVKLPMSSPRCRAVLRYPTKNPAARRGALAARSRASARRRARGARAANRRSGTPSRGCRRASRGCESAATRTAAGAAKAAGPLPVRLRPPRSRCSPEPESVRPPPP